MENHNGSSNRDGSKSNGQRMPWLDLRVFYVRVSQCVIDESTPEFLTLNHMPLNRDTLLEVNSVRAGTYPNPISALLRRDRLDRRSEEATFVSTDVIRMTGSTKFEVVVEDVVVLSGVIELCRSNGSVRDPDGHHGHGWSMRCESDLVPGNGFMKLSRSLGSPSIDVYVTGTFQGNPIILTNTFHLSSPRNRTTNSFTQDHNNSEESYQNRHHDQIPQMTEDTEHKDQNEERYNNDRDDNDNNLRMQQYQEYPEGELSWFNAGVRVGVGIGLSVCLGIGIGVGLLVRTYQGTARNFRRQLF